MPTISSISTEVPGSTSDLIGNIGSTTKRFQVKQLPNYNDIGFNGFSCQTIHHESTNVLALPWDIPDYDNGDMHSSITSTLITVPIGSSGIYTIHINAILGSASSFTGLKIVAGGSSFFSERIQSTAGGLFIEMTAIARIDGGGTIIAYSKNIEGSTLEVVPIRITVQKIGQYSTA